MATMLRRVHALSQEGSGAQEGSGSEGPSVVSADKHFSLGEKLFGGVGDYDRGFKDRSDALDSAKRRLTATKELGDMRSTGHVNMLNTSAGTLGVYVYKRDGYFWQGKNITENIASLGCADCFFSATNAGMPDYVDSVLAILPNASFEPVDSVFQSRAERLPEGGSFEVLYGNSPYESRIYEGGGK